MTAIKIYPNEVENLSERIDDYRKMNEAEKIQRDIWYRDGQRSMLGHNKPSDDTIKMFKLMEKDIGTIQTSVVRMEGTMETIATVMQGLKESHDELKDDFKEQRRKVDGFEAKANETYANKSVEKDLKELSTLINTRNYDWLRYMTVTLISIIVTIVIYNKLHL